MYDYKILNSLEELPILKTWEDDAGKFITMGQVYTQNLDKTQNNLGMYRLQMSDKNELLMHWQIHKDGANFYHEYKNAGFKKNACKYSHRWRSALYLVFSSTFA